MSEKKKTFPKLLRLLKTIEQEVKKSTKVLLINAKARNVKGKGKAKAKSKPKAQKQAFTITKPTSRVRKGKVVSIHCDKAGNWRKHHKTYLKSKKKKSVVSGLGIFITKINFSTSMSQVMDTGCVSHICSNM